MAMGLAPTAACPRLVCAELHHGGESVTTTHTQLVVSRVSSHPRVHVQILFTTFTIFVKKFVAQNQHVHDVARLFHSLGSNEALLVNERTVMDEIEIDGKPLHKIMSHKDFLIEILR